jgi:hypothetical protein
MNKPVMCMGNYGCELILYHTCLAIFLYIKWTVLLTRSFFSKIENSTLTHHICFICYRRLHWTNFHTAATQHFVPSSGSESIVGEGRGTPIDVSRVGGNADATPPIDVSRVGGNADTTSLIDVSRVGGNAGAIS